MRVSYHIAMVWQSEMIGIKNVQDVHGLWWGLLKNLQHNENEQKIKPCEGKSCSSL